MKTQTEGVAMKPATPKTELPPSTQLRKAVFGGARVKRIVAPVLWSVVVNLISATVVQSADSIVVWGAFSPTNAPANLTNVVSVTAGSGFNVALTGEGRAIAWGSQTGSGQINSVPAGLSNVVAVAAGLSHALALKADGTVVGWGLNGYGKALPPAGLSNVVAIAAGKSHSVALKSDGTVVAWGYPDTTNAPSGSGFVSIGAGDYHSLAVKSDGTVLAWGNGYDGMNVPTGLSNVVAVAGSERQSMALKSDGSVVFWGNNVFCGAATVPANLTNVVAISSKDSLSLALKSDGTVFAWGCVVSETNLPAGLSNVVAIAAGPDHGVALRLVGTNLPPPVMMSPRVLIGTLDRPFYSRITAKYASMGYGVVGLPPGLNINTTTGIITGTPTASGTFSVSLWATNETGVGQLSAQLFINLPIPSITSSRTAIASLSVGFQYQVTAENGPTSFGAVGLPSGLSINQTTGLITGVPTQSGAFSVTLMASNSYGTASAALNLTVIEVAAWGEYAWGQTNLPPTLTNVVSISAEFTFALALRANGTVIQWGSGGGVPAGLSNVVAIAAGSQQSLALKTDGTVTALGYTSALPPGLSNVVAIAAGDHYALALKSDGTVMAWDVFSSGLTNIPVPPDLVYIIAIAAGDNHSLALRADGTVVAWGENFSGQTNVPPGLSNVVAIAAGDDASFAFLADGTLIRWGADFVPAGLTNLTGISAGSSHALGLRNDARVLAWGDNSSGQTNVPATLSNVASVLAAGRSSYALVGNPPGTTLPVFVGPSALVATVDRVFQLRIRVKNGATGFSITGLPPGLQLNPLNGIITGSPTAAGIYNVMISATNAAGVSQFAMTLHVNVPLPAITSSRVAYAYPGLLFTYRITAANNPTSFAATSLPPSLSLNPATGLISGVFTGLGTHSIGLSASNAYGVVQTELALIVTEIAAWGANSAGQISIAPNLTNVVSFSAGEDYNLALRADGTVVGWGANSYGKATPPLGLTNVIAISAGSDHSLALKSDATVVAWGDDWVGKTAVPPGLSNVVAIAAAGDHSLALKSDGSIVGWGLNRSGEAAPPLGLSNVISIATGDEHSIALRADGTVVVWGFFWSTNGFPSGLSNVVAIAAGNGHGLALKRDGSVVSWGGVGSDAPPSGLTNVVAIAAGGGSRVGGGHSMALRSDGTTVAWGANDSGQTSVPSELRKVAAISAGGQHSLALIGGLPTTGIDLVPTNVAINTNQLWAGSTATVSWQGFNSFGLPVRAYWTDGIYLSRDPAWSADDILLGTAVHAGGLATNEIYSNSTVVQIPGVFPTNYYVLVRADTYFQVNEGQKETNNVAAIGPFSVMLSTLSTNGPAAGILTAAMRSAWYAVDVPAGQNLVVTLNDGNGIGHNEMYVRFGQPPTRTEYDARGSVSLGANQNAAIANTSGGTYYVLVYGESVPDEPADFNLAATLPELAVTEITPSKGGNSGQVTVKINAVGFQDLDSVQLVSPSNSVVTAFRTNVVSETEIWATFELIGFDAGNYSVRLTRTGGGSALLTNGFEVVEGGGANLQTRVLIPSVVRGGQSGTFQVEVANVGLNDAPPPVVWLHLPAGLNVSLSSNSPPQSIEAVLLDTKPQDCPFHVLQPSGDLRIPGFYSAENQALEGSVDLEVHAGADSLDIFLSASTASYSDSLAGYTVAGDSTFINSISPWFISILNRDFGNPPWDYVEVSSGQATPNSGNSYFSVLAGAGHVGASLSISPNSDWIQVVKSWSEPSASAPPTLPYEGVDPAPGTKVFDTHPFYYPGAVTAPFSDYPGAQPAVWAALAAQYGSGRLVKTLVYHFEAETHPATWMTPPLDGGEIVTVGKEGVAWNFDVTAESVNSQYATAFKIVLAFDPNDKIGPRGFGVGRFVSPSTTLPYIIHFENESSATAPAQIVRITDILNTNLDLSTFELSELAFGDNTILVPAGLNYYSTNLNLGSNLLVHIEAGLNSETRTAYWSFESLDPQTQSPPDDPLAGFLPPNDGTHEGEGHVSFFIRPVAGTPTGTEIRNVALITFDQNPPIATDQRDPHDPSQGTDPDKEAPNTIDSGAPASAVLSLSPQSGRTFAVRWSGADDPGGCGVADYDVYVSSDGTNYTRWLTSARTNQAWFQGELGRIYSFFSVSRDWVGNMEQLKSTAEASTTIPTNAPVLAVVTNRTVEVGEAISITNLVQGTTSGSFLFSLGQPAPASASVNPTNGVFHWTPECSNGSTTNTFTVWVTDSGATNLSDAVTFSVVVRECVTPQLGTVVVRAGDSARVPINLVSSAALTNLVMALHVPPNRFTNLRLETVAPQICTNVVLEETNNLYRLTFATCSNQWLIGTQQLAWLWLTAVTNQKSAFVPLQLTDLTGIRSDGVVVTNLFAGSGRVIVVGEEPLLEAVWGTNGRPVITLYGQTARDHVLETATNVQGPWLAQPQFTMTNLWLELTVPTNVPQQFYRAKGLVP